MRIILLLLVLGVLIYLMLRSQQLENWWRQREGAEDGEPSRFGRFRERTSQQLQTTWQRIRPEQPQPPTPEAFVAWAANSLTLDAETAVWFNSLSVDHLAVLTQFIDEFCESMGFELNWLLNEELADKPDLENTLTTVVKHYLEACRLTFAVRDDLLAFNAPPEAEAAPRASLSEMRNRMEQSVRTILRRKEEPVEHSNGEMLATE